jgi:hypothetical protein
MQITIAFLFTDNKFSKKEITITAKKEAPLNKLNYERFC